MTPPFDPVRDRRRRIARLAAVGKRVGYSCLAAAMIAFVVAFATGFPSPLPGVVVALMALAAALLAPSIVFAYAARAAERDDRERGV